LKIQTVIIGGGIVGAAVAYHLAKLGRRDIVLLEQGRLTCGTTWHAAGLVGQMRPNRSMTRMSQYGIRLYSTLEQETGLATGWKRCGSVNVARTRSRWIVFQRQAAMARSFGIEVDLLTPQQALEKWPILRIADLQGALWFPADGKANPADLAQSLAVAQPPGLEQPQVFQRLHRPERFEHRDRPKQLEGNRVNEHLRIAPTQHHAVLIHGICPVGWGRPR
jgi:glycine/D-amino acid oxidase-like deaminating enzyme